MQSAAATTARYRVTVVAKSRESEFWKAVLSGAEAAATEYNMQLTVLAPDNEENYDAQNQLIEKAVSYTHLNHRCGRPAARCRGAE